MNVAAIRVPHPETFGRKERFLATSPDVPGLVAEGRGVTEATEIAQGLARKIAEWCESSIGDPLPRALANLPGTADEFESDWCRSAYRSGTAVVLVTGTIMPLDDIRVLDAATFVAAPFAGTCLAEFGADVIKIERPGVGDDLRRLGTPSEAGDTFWWLNDARNKKCVTLNLKDERGAALFLRLADDRGRGDRELPAGHHGEMGARGSRTCSRSIRGS